MFVRFVRAVRSAFQRKTVNGRVQILHSAPWSSFSIWTYGLSGRQDSHEDGKSVDSQPERLRSCLIWGGAMVAELYLEESAVGYEQRCRGLNVWEEKWWFSDRE
jgi:hypothetical protein